MPYDQVISRQALTAKSTPDEDSTIELGALPAAAEIYFAIEPPARDRDVILLISAGGANERELLIPESAGGSEHYPTPIMKADEGPFHLKAAADTAVTLNVIRAYE